MREELNPARSVQYRPGCLCGGQPSRVVWEVAGPLERKLVMSSHDYEAVNASGLRIHGALK